MASKRLAAKAGASSAVSPTSSGASTAASEASSIGGSLAAMTALGASRANQVSKDIENLLLAQRKAREEKKRLANAMKNARRRRSRLTKRARLLSTEDLLTVVALREADRSARAVGAASVTEDAEAQEDDPAGDKEEAELSGEERAAEVEAPGADAPVPEPIAGADR